MKAIRIKSLVTSTDQLEVTTLPDLPASKDHYVVQVQAAGTNFFDVLQVQGKHQIKPPLPFIAGNEFAGVVVKTPTTASQSAFKVGDRVFGGGLGAFATQIYAKEEDMRKTPDKWTSLQASGVFLTAPTAYTALVHRANAKAGEYVVILGAAGGLGLVAIQIAAALGLKVIAVTNSDKKKAACKRFGAHHVLDSDDKWQEAARELTPNRRGVDIVLDPLGMVDRSLKCIAWNGRIVVIGFAAGAIEKIAMNKILLKNCSISGIFWGRYAAEEPETVVKVWEELLKLMAQGKIRPTIYNEEEFNGLESLPQAFKTMAKGEAWGKIAVTVEDDAIGSKL